jgi:hypothetical protein
LAGARGKAGSVAMEGESGMGEGAEIGEIGGSKGGPKEGGEVREVGVTGSGERAGPNTGHELEAGGDERG